MNSIFLDSVMTKAFKHFEYYRHGPIEMHNLKPGFIFQACVDKTFDEMEVECVETGLGDHCLPDLGVSLQLKTTAVRNPSDYIIFCRSSVKGQSALKQKQLRMNDVEGRMYDMFGVTGTSQFILTCVNLTTKAVEHYLLYDDGKFVGTWFQIENIYAPHKQTHFFIKKSALVKL